MTASSLVYDCPDGEACKACPCAGEDDVCFPGERLRAEVAALGTQLKGAVDENEKLRLQVVALENDGMELAARLGEAEEQIARLERPQGQSS